MGEFLRARALPPLAFLVALGGLVCFVLGFLFWQNATFGSNQVAFPCQCVAIGSEALIGATLALVGILVIPVASAVGIWALLSREEPRRALPGADEVETG